MNRVQQFFTSFKNATFAVFDALIVRVLTDSNVYTHEQRELAKIYTQAVFRGNRLSFKSEQSQEWLFSWMMSIDATKYGQPGTVLALPRRQQGGLAWLILGNKTYGNAIITQHGSLAGDTYTITAKPFLKNHLVLKAEGTAEEMLQEFKYLQAFLKVDVSSQQLSAMKLGVLDITAILQHQQLRTVKQALPKLFANAEEYTGSPGSLKSHHELVTLDFSKQKEFGALLKLKAKGQTSVYVFVGTKEFGNVLFFSPSPEVEEPCGYCISFELSQRLARPSSGIVWSMETYAALTGQFKPTPTPSSSDPKESEDAESAQSKSGNV